MLSFLEMKREYLNKKDLQAYLRIGPATVNRLMKDGLPFIKPRGKVLFRRDLVDTWLEARIVRAKKS